MSEPLSTYIAHMETTATRSGDPQRWWMLASFGMALWAAGIQRVDAWQTKLHAAWTVFGTRLLEAASVRAFD